MYACGTKQLGNNWKQYATKSSSFLNNINHQMAIFPFALQKI